MATGKKRENLLTVYVLGLTLFVLLRDLGGVSVNKYIIVAFCALLFMLEPVDALVPSILFTFPLLCGLPGNYIMPVGFVAYLIKKRHFCKDQLLFIVFVVLMETMASVFYAEIDLAKMVGYVVQASLFFVLILEKEPCFSFEKAIRCCVFGTVLVSVVILAATLRDAPADWLALMARGAFRFGRVEAEYGNELRMTLNANGFSYYSITGISCLVVLLKDGRGKRFWELAELAILLCAGVLSFSRTWVLLMLVLVLLTYFSCASSLAKALRTTAVLAIAVFAVGAVISRLPDVSEGIISRFSDQNLLTAGRRTDIFREYWSAFWNHARCVVMGAGVTQYKSVLMMRDSLHNAMLQILVCYGVFGALIFCYGWLKGVARYISNVKLLYWIPFICTFCFSQSVQIVNPPNELFPHLISVIVLQYGAQKTLEKGSNDEELDHNSRYGGR